MIFNATRIAAGISLLGAGGLAGVLLAPKTAESERAASTLPLPAPVVRTVHIKRVHHRVIHEKPKRVHHAAVGAATDLVPIAPEAAAPAPTRPATAAPAPAPTGRPLRTRTSGSGTTGQSEHEHEGGEHGGGDD